MKSRIILLLLFYLIYSCKNKDNNLNKSSSNTIQSLMKRNADTLLLDSLINSVSIGIFKNGKKYTAHYGELDKGKHNTPTDKTIYEIASVSKTFTGVLVANAVLNNTIGLEDDIRKYLKEDFKNFEFQNQPIKIKHLLTHTSRMSKFLPESINVLFNDFNEELPFKVYDIQKKYDKKTFINDLKQIQLDTFPGIQYKYSNVDTELMGLILENVYGKTFNEIVKSYFQKNANMSNTQVQLSKEQEKYLANGYGMTGKLVPHETFIYGADGGIKTTIPDLVNYMELHLSLDNTTITEAHRNLLHHGNKKIGYYIPIRKNKEYGIYYSMHGGGFGTQNWLFILPKYNLGVSVVTNQSGLNTADKLIKVVKGLIKELK